MQLAAVLEQSGVLRVYGVGDETKRIRRSEIQVLDPDEPMLPLPLRAAPRPKRTTGLEPATSSLGSSRSTN
jgi:hypothetical protein